MLGQYSCGPDHCVFSPPFPLYMWGYLCLYEPQGKPRNSTKITDPWHVHWLVWWSYWCLRASSFTPYCPPAWIFRTQTSKCNWHTSLFQWSGNAMAAALESWLHAQHCSIPCRGMIVCMQVWQGCSQKNRLFSLPRWSSPYLMELHLCLIEQ